MQLSELLVRTHGQPTLWLELRDLLVLCASSRELATVLDEMPFLWTPHALVQRRARPVAYRQAETDASTVQRTRGAGGRLRPLRAAERRTLAALRPRVVLGRLVSVSNAGVVAYERRCGDPSRYPKGYCRECVAYVPKLVWGGRCLRCFERRDLELTATDCSELGLAFKHRSDLPVRYQRAGYVWRKLYRLSDVHRRFRTVGGKLPPRPSAVQRLARRCTLQAFRRRLFLL